MTISEQTNPFLSLADEQYVSLVTFRKNGVAVATPMWFAEEQGVIYITTGANLAKVRRIRHTPRVLLAPCDARGKIKGATIEGKEHIVNDEGELEIAEGALALKYGVKRELFYWFMKAARALQHKEPIENVYLAIER